MRRHAAPVGPDGWVQTERARSSARLTSTRRFPHRVLLGKLRRQRGVTTDNALPTGAHEILERLAELPLSVWTYGFDHDTVRHLGPMSQDFAAAFGLGDSDRKIDMVDANGVVMAACQALYRRVIALEGEVAALRAVREDTNGSITS